VLPVYTFYPGDYRNRDKVLKDAEKNPTYISSGGQTSLLAGTWKKTNSPSNCCRRYRCIVAAEIGNRSAPTQTSSAAATQVVQYADPKAEVKAEPTLPSDPAAKQRAMDAELDRATKRAIDVELNRAIMRAFSDAKEYDRKHRGDQ
jgi:hypothetical protein